MLDQYIEKMWFRTNKQPADGQDSAVKAVIKAQEKAVDNLDDFQFCLNIAVDKNNVERNPVNAANIWKYFDKEVVPAWKKLDERSQLVCRLDWYGAVYRAVEEISRLPHAVNDRASVQFVRALGLQKRWEEASRRYHELEAGSTAAPWEDFDRWLTVFTEEIVEPQNRLWTHAEKVKSVQHFFARMVGTIAAAGVLYVLISYFSGYGYVARRLGHEKMLAYATEEKAEKGIDGFGTFEPIAINDFNASSIRADDSGKKEDGEYSDRLLRDGSPATAWEEGEADSGINRRLYFNIKGSQTVHYLVIWNGNQKDEESFAACNRLKDVTIRINDRMHSYRVTLKDQMGPQYVRIERTDVDKLWIIIKSVYKGNDTADNTAVSEVEIY